MFKHSIYLRPPDSPVGYKPWEPSGKPTMSPAPTMLPVPRDSVASQECVEENPIGERTDGPVTELAEKPELAGHSEGGGEERAPLLYVRGQRWSPGVYRSMRLLGRPVEIAWERAFIALPTF